MKLLRDKTIDVLDSALSEIKLREWEARKNCEARLADGLYCAWKILDDVHAEYVSQKAKRNPIFRWRIWLGYKKASKAIRDIKL